MEQEKQTKQVEPSISYSVRQAIDTLDSLTTYSYSTRAFGGKWQAIRSKVEELNTSLMAIQNCDSSENPSLHSLLTAIISSANQCFALATMCVDLSFNGKLLMQSDLDFFASKFDSHAKNLSCICTSGILSSHGFAIVVLRPSFNACRDDMRFYVRDLLTRLKIGDSVMRRQALIDLHEVVCDDDRYVRVVLEVQEILNFLVGFVEIQEAEVQELAVKIVSLLSRFDMCKAVLISAGMISPLVRVLESESELGVNFAVRSLYNLTLNSENAWSVSSHGGVSALLKICSISSRGSTGELIVAACSVLRNLVGVEEIKRFMIEAGAISTFIRLTDSKDEAVQVSSIEFLQSIALGDESVRELVAQGGGTRAFLGVMDPSSSFSTTKSRERALRAIANIFFPSSSCVHVLMYYGFLDKLLFFLRNGDVSLQELALKVSVKLCETSNEAKKAMGGAGFMAEFVKFLSTKSCEVREVALEALHVMMSLHKNRIRFVQDDRSIGFILKLLDDQEEPDYSDNYRKLLVSILMSLTSCNRGRRKITKSGYLNKIEKLVEYEATDAKKLVMKLSRSRFQVMLNGIWHS